MPSELENPFEALEGRRFAFYPAIRNVSHNEWTLEEETWSEIRARNLETDESLWIPRNHLAGISSVEKPVVIVGLRRELQLRNGIVSPYREPVVAMPGAPTPRPSSKPEPEPPPPNRDTSTDTATFSLISRALLIGVAGLLALSFFAFEGVRNPIQQLFRPDSSTTDQRYLTLTAQSDIHDVVARVGQPDREQWITPEEAELQFQALHYPERRYVVILMGGDRSEARYIGTLHASARSILDSARLSGGGDASAMMRNLPEF